MCFWIAVLGFTWCISGKTQTANQTHKGYFWKKETLITLAQFSITTLNTYPLRHLTQNELFWVHLHLQLKLAPAFISVFSKMLSCPVEERLPYIHAGTPKTTYVPVTAYSM